jgi:hypothetical protein
MPPSLILAGYQAIRKSDRNGLVCLLQLTSFGDCRERFAYGVLPRCAVCPLFDAERAIRDVLGENPPPGFHFEITFGSNLRALGAGELPPDPADDFEVPDFPPEEWGEHAAGEPPG